MTTLHKFLSACFLAVLLVIVGCQKNDYFKDSGRQDGAFNGSTLEYLQSKPQYFDSLRKVIKLAGMESVFSSEDITFFAPADSSINRTIVLINSILRAQGKKEVTNLAQIKPQVWRNQLARYVFKGKKSMNDYPQLDSANISAYPGQIYSSYDGHIMNVGVIYNDAGGVRYAGYRQLTISYIPSPSTPRDYNSWFPAIVASVNVAPKNGYVHVLQYVRHYFGFDPLQFLENAEAAGID